MRLFTYVLILVVMMSTVSTLPNYKLEVSDTPHPTKKDMKETAIVVSVSLASTCLGCLALVAAMGLFAKWRRSRTNVDLGDEETPTDHKALLNESVNTSYSVDYSFQDSENAVEPVPDPKQAHRRSWRISFSGDVNLNLGGEVLAVEEIPVSGQEDELDAEELKLENCTIEKHVNANTSSELFKGSLDDGSSVAIKKVTVADVESFENEMRVLSTLNHPNIVPFVGSMKQEEHSFIMTKFVTNHSLDWHLTGDGAVLKSYNMRHTALPFQTKVNILIGVCKGMKYLHSKYLVHGNLKTSNVLLDANFNAHVTDFGLARFINTTKKKLVNDIQYMSPEAIQGSAAPSIKDDTYSFAIIMYETFFETTNVYKINDESELEQLKEKISEAKVRPEIPDINAKENAFTNQEKEYLALTQRCWAADANKRPMFGEIYHGLFALFQK